MSDTYVYIDGAFLRDRGTVALKQLYDPTPTFDLKSVRGMTSGAKRVFYYDCIEERPRPGETEEAFELRTAEQTALLDRISETALCHVRLGTLKERQRGRGISQKEVDVKMSVDMLTHAMSGIIDKAVLMTGDLDLRPVVETLVIQRGVVVELMYDPLVTARELIVAADLHRPLRMEDWWALTSDDFRAQAKLPPPRWFSGPAHGQVVKTGRLGASSVRLVNNLHDKDWSVELPNYKGSPNLTRITSTDRDLLLRYVPIEVGEIEWN